MIEINRAKLEKAITKANSVRNHVRPLAWRKYEVRTPQGHVYIVSFDVQQGRKLAACNCAAKAECYHIASALALHCAVARTRKQEEPICETPNESRPRPDLLVKPQPKTNSRYEGIEI